MVIKENTCVLLYAELFSDEKGEIPVYPLLLSVPALFMLTLPVESTCHFGPEHSARAQACASTRLADKQTRPDEEQ